MNSVRQLVERLIREHGIVCAHAAVERGRNETCPHPVDVSQHTFDDAVGHFGHLLIQLTVGWWYPKDYYSLEDLHSCGILKVCSWCKETLAMVVGGYRKQGDSHVLRTDRVFTIGLEDYRTFGHSSRGARVVVSRNPGKDVGCSACLNLRRVRTSLSQARSLIQKNSIRLRCV